MLTRRFAAPLIIRLRNWVGDVVLAVPTLRMLESQGYQLHLVGKPWAQELLEGEGWKVAPLASSLSARITQLRSLRAACQAVDPGFDARPNALVMPFSFSSALEMRLAGLKAVGQRHEGRSLLLQVALPRTPQCHESESYWRLAGPLVQGDCPPTPPREVQLNIAKRHDMEADELLKTKSIPPGYTMLCPFAGGTFEKKPKTWPQFPALAKLLKQQHERVVLCPGPGEEHLAQAFDDCIVLPGIKLGLYGALIRKAKLMISNDTGPGHLAAAIGTTTLSILGPTNAAQWGVRGERTHIVQGPNRTWPSLEQVLGAVKKLT